MGVTRTINRVRCPSMRCGFYSNLSIAWLDPIGVCGLWACLNDGQDMHGVEVMGVVHSKIWTWSPSSLRNDVATIPT